MDALVASNHAVNPVSSAATSAGESTAVTPATAVTVTSAGDAATVKMVNGNGGSSSCQPLSNGAATRLNGGATKQRHSSSDCRSTGSLSNLED